MKAKHPTLEGGGAIESYEVEEGEQRNFLPKSIGSGGSNKITSGIPATSSVDFGSLRQSVLVIVLSLASSLSVGPRVLSLYSPLFYFN